MKIRVCSLTIQCKGSREFIPFSPQVSFFHGGTSAGKSSIVRMIDFCLGGNLEITPAVAKEVLSVAIDVQLGERQCILERESLGSNEVHVTWGDSDGEHHLRIPIVAGNEPVYGSRVYNLSDLIFEFCGIQPLKVRKNKTDPDAKLIRLSFRDVMWYCYLDQNELDSSFFHLRQPILEGKSRDVMRFVVGYYTDRLQQLEIESEALLAKRAGNISAIAEMRSVLDRLGYANEQRIRDEKEATETELETALENRAVMSKEFHATTHFADKLRQKLRALSEQLGREEATLAAIRQRLSDQTALKAEFTTARIKLTRMATASSVLQKVQFMSCPLCGTDVAVPESLEDCPLCKCVPHRKSPKEESERIEQQKRDLEGRISELADSLHRSENALLKQSFEVSSLRSAKSQLDQQLVAELREYDSAYVAETRELDRRVATLQERVSYLVKMAQLPEAIDRLTAEIEKSRLTEQSIRRQMEEERAGLTSSGEIIGEIETAYHDALRKVGVPGVGPDDTVLIDRKNWIPSILERGEEEFAWSFFNAGSGGKKTLLTVCYALAIHQVAAKRGLPLPSFLIIDTPMKNISEDVNQDIFEALYRYLYSLVEGDLAATQVIIIDKEYIEPPDGIELRERLMMPDDAANPPLISYYRGA